MTLEFVFSNSSQPLLNDFPMHALELVAAVLEAEGELLVSETGQGASQFLAAPASETQRTR